jgi:hypothetical protein
MGGAFERYDRAGTPHAIITDGAATPFQGRVEDIAVHGDGLDMTAFGYQRALSDARYTALWSTTRVADWYSATTDQLTNADPSRFQIDTNNRLFIAPQKNATYANAGANFVIGGLVFDLPRGASRNANAGGIQFSYETNTPLNWLTQLQIFNSAGALIAAPWSLASTGALATGAIFLNALAGNPTRFIFELFYNAAAAAYALETGAAYLKITNLRITTGRTHEVNTTWSAPAGPVTGVQTVTPASMVGIYLGQQLVIAQGIAVNAEIVTVTAVTGSTFTATFVKTHAAGHAIQACQVYADEIVDDLVSVTAALNSTQLQTDTSQVTSPGVDLQNEVYEDQPPAAILDYLIGLGDSAAIPNQWEWGVTGLRALYYRVAGAVAQTWYVDVTSLTVQRSLNQLFNSAYAVYADAGGRTLRGAVSTDAASVLQRAITRTQAVSARTTSLTQANVQRDASLSDTADPPPRFGLTFSAVYNSVGGRVPLWLPRAGDTIVIRNLPPTISTNIDQIRSFQIARTSCDLIARTLTIEPLVPLPSVQALLAHQK